MEMLRRLIDSALFWSAWIIIPLLMEILPSLFSLFVIAKRRKEGRKKTADPKVWPEITLIIPVYNSAGSLEECIDSAATGTYPGKRIRIFMVNNGSKDDSFAVYEKCQLKYPDIHMQWLNAEQGKSRALNLALYNSAGKYIINIDSDGLLAKDALCNLVRRFESDLDLNVMTGTILTDYRRIGKGVDGFTSFLQKCEFMEYAQTFLAGRSYASELNTMYTLSGAFSAFRKSAILNSRMYNTITIGEDTHMTFQMRYLLHERVEACEDAVFMVDPIESFNKLYVQRQRWQRGSLEVAHMFIHQRPTLRNLYRDVGLKTLVYDHTFAFPRLIWYLALILLTVLNYSGADVLNAFGLIFFLYVLSGFMYFESVQQYLKTTPDLRKYYVRHWWVVAALPLYNLIVFFMRFAGVINSINSGSSWRSRDLSEEADAFSEVIREDSQSLQGAFAKADVIINQKDEQKHAAIRWEAGIFACIVLAICIGLSGYVHRSGLPEDLIGNTEQVREVSNEEK